tara:strand:+ start:429 stop:608 length:180 start_codon:yes stop_codon:yes gene_type:complete
MPGIIGGKGVMGMGDPNAALEVLKEICNDNDRLKDEMHQMVSANIKIYYSLHKQAREFK